MPKIWMETSVVFMLLCLKAIGQNAMPFFSQISLDPSLFYFCVHLRDLRANFFFSDNLIPEILKSVKASYLLGTNCKNWSPPSVVASTPVLPQ